MNKDTLKEDIKKFFDNEVFGKIDQKLKGYIKDCKDMDFLELISLCYKEGIQRSLGEYKGTSSGATGFNEYFLLLIVKEFFIKKGLHFEEQPTEREITNYWRCEYNKKPTFLTCDIDLTEFLDKRIKEKLKEEIKKSQGVWWKPDIAIIFNRKLIAVIQTKTYSDVGNLLGDIQKTKYSLEMIKPHLPLVFYIPNNIAKTGRGKHENDWKEIKDFFNTGYERAFVITKTEDFTKNGFKDIEKTKLITLNDGLQKIIEDLKLKSLQNND